MGISLPTLSFKLTGKRIIRFSFALTFALGLTIAAKAQNGAVGIGTNAPNEKAILDVTSTEKGLLIPRMTTAERDAILDPNNTPIPLPDFNGLLIYNTTDGVFNVWKDDNWIEVGSGAAGATGAGVFSAEIDNDGKLKLTLTDQSVITADGIAKGNDGATWFSGDDINNVNDPKGGDFHLNSITGDVYKFDGLAGWNFVTNLKNGPKGDDGEQGEDGQSAYDLWKTVPGNELKSDIDFLNSLKGEAGDPGAAGESAYALWESQLANNGKSEAQFLAELIGADGKSAYQEWLDAGNVGTEAQFLASLEGAAGKSAYQEWLDAGNVGTEAQFLASLEGAAGKSAYQEWLDAGNVGTEAQFLASLEGADGAQNAWGLAGNAGTAGNISQYVGTSDAQPLLFATNDTEAMRILTDGKVGIGTPSPDAKLHVRGDFKLGQSGTRLNNIIYESVSVDIPSITKGTGYTHTFTVPGAALNATVAISPEFSFGLIDGIIICYARVSAVGSVEVKFFNVNTTTDINPPSMNYNITVIK